MYTQSKRRPSVPGKRGCDINLPEERKSRKLKIGTGNVNGLNQERKLDMLINEISKFKMDILGVAETHWTEEILDAFELNGYVIIHAKNNNNIRRKGVAIIVSKEISKYMSTFQQISERLISATFKFNSGILTVFQTYAPDSSYADTDYEEHLDLLQNKINELHKKDSYILLWDFNAIVGENAYKNWSDVVGKFGLGNMNDRSEQFLQFCAINNLVISNTMYKHKYRRRATWRSPDGKTKNQIDYICVQRNLKHFIRNARTYNSADVGSDHSLVILTILIELIKTKPIPRVPGRCNVEKLINNSEVSEEFKVKLGGYFEPLINIDENNIEVEDLYKKFKDIVNNTTKAVVGFKKRKLVDGMPLEIEKLCEKRREARLKMLKNPNNVEFKELYKQLNKDVKKEVKVCKIKEIDERVKQLEHDFKQNNSKNLFKAVKEIEKKPNKKLNVIKDKSGKKHTIMSEVLICWEEHFQKHLNTEFLHEPLALNSITVNPAEEEPEQCFTIEEIAAAIKETKSKKAPGIDEITAEVIKAGGEPMQVMLEKLFRKIWNNEISPSDWQKMLVTPIHKKGDKLNPVNYRAISLLSIPGKVFNRIILNRIKDKVEGFLKES